MKSWIIFLIDYTQPLVVRELVEFTEVYFQRPKERWRERYSWTSDSKMAAESVWEAVIWVTVEREGCS